MRAGQGHTAGTWQSQRLTHAGTSQGSRLRTCAQTVQAGPSVVQKGPGDRRGTGGLVVRLTVQASDGDGKGQRGQEAGEPSVTVLGSHKAVIESGHSVPQEGVCLDEARVPRKRRADRGGDLPCPPGPRCGQGPGERGCSADG